MKKKIENYTRNCVFSELKEFDYLSKEDAFIELIEWKNGEGVDINISSFQDKYIQLTWGEVKAIRKLANKLLKK